MKKFILVCKKVPLLVMVGIFLIFLFVMGIIGKYRAYSKEDYNFWTTSSVETMIQGLHDGVFPWDEPKKEENFQVEVEKPKKEIEIDGYLSAEAEAEERNVSLESIIEQRKLESNGTYVYGESQPEGVNSTVMEAIDYGICDPKYLTPEGVTYEKLTTPVFEENNDYYLQTKAEDDSYFDDALFIGDSRSVGLVDYGDLDTHAIFFAQESLSIYDLDTATLQPVGPAGKLEEQTLLNLLSQNEFGKVYICLGVNELGTGDTLRFYNAFKALIETIRVYEPDAIIYIQGMMHVTQSYSSKDSIYNNTSIVDKNKAISTLANGHDIFYLDMNETVCDENGNLIAELSTDGVHLLGKNYRIWEDYIKTHVIVRNEKDK
ncbi:MAG: hypothetical protein K6F30_01360 [Lachnospiraceae bacterium]|nr:hypothetical protein [Lachnospiraceae bacterium]